MQLRSFLQQRSLSRRKITQMINEGKVFLNGKKVESFNQEIISGDEISIFGEKDSIKVEVKETSDYIILFNKPKGYVVSKSDPHNTTIYEILPPDFFTLYYIGRLDKESRGLLLLTNNPTLVHQYEHPSNEITKEYLVTLDRKLEKSDQLQSLKGIKDEEDLLKFHSLEIFPQTTTVNVVLTEGKKRHIRRVFKALGYEVLDLQRIREGEFILGDISEGKREKVNLSVSSLGKKQ